MNIISWGILIGLVYFQYRRRTEKPVIWKMLIVVYIGLFCFNFQFPLGDIQMKIAILPLGVWILVLVFGKKKERWNVYRPFAWIGFFGNYIFLITTLLISPIQNFMYPTDKLENHHTPSSIPNENRLKKMILDTGELNIDTILKQIALDGKHVFIPHLSSDKQYGYSLLE